MSPPDTDPTRMLRLAREGDARAASDVFALLESELREIAAALMQRERDGHTLQPTALVHEAWLRLFGAGADAPFEDRAHFLRVVARAMRRILVDHARARLRAKRDGGGRVEPLDATVAAVEGARRVELLALDEALEQLAAIDARGARVVELRYFAGLTNEDVARVLDVSLPTVERSWRVARLWLSRALGDE